MKKITPTQRIVEIFSTEDLPACQMLLEMAQGIVRQRQGEAPNKAARRFRPAKVADANLTQKAEA